MPHLICQCQVLAHCIPWMANPFFCKKLEQGSTILRCQRLLDGGSQRSYIIEYARRLLGLILKGEQQLSIAIMVMPSSILKRDEVLLPWKQFHKPLSINYNLSLSRLHGLLCRLQQSSVLLRDYNQVMLNQIHNGIVEDVPTETYESALVHYLPHLYYRQTRRQQNCVWFMMLLPKLRASRF